MAPTIHVTNEYKWFPEIHNLPVLIELDFTCNKDSDEFIPCFSYNQKQWGKGVCDALSWYMSPHRHDFTFRTGLFDGFPEEERTPGFNVQVGQKYHMMCRIEETGAEYHIDGEFYAKTNYSKGTVPITGYFGIAVYSPVDILVENVSVLSLRGAYTKNARNTGE